jgi:hypothetical protein
VVQVQERSREESACNDRGMRFSRFSIRICRRCIKSASCRVAEGAVGKRTISAFLGTILHRRGESRRFPSLTHPLILDTLSAENRTLSRSIDGNASEKPHERGLFGFSSDVYLTRCVFGAGGSLRWKRTVGRSVLHAFGRNWSRILDKRNVAKALPRSLDAFVDTLTEPFRARSSNS